MKRLSLTVPLIAWCVLPALAAEGDASAGKLYDQQLASLERQFLALAEAMPAEKYGFAPTGGEFKGVRTFGQQVSHVAAVIYMVSAAVLGEKNPSEAGPNENGPADLKTRDQILQYLKDSFAYGHKAMNSLTERNLTEMVPSPFGDNKVSRLSMASAAIWHSFDHYGQMAVYARMNGIIPPASRR